MMPAHTIWWTGEKWECTCGRLDTDRDDDAQNHYTNAFYGIESRLR